MDPNALTLQINKNVLLNGLQQVLHVAGMSSTTPILNNVLLKTNQDFLELTTTNLDLGIRCAVQARIERAGSITLPVNKFVAIVKALPDGDIAIHCSNEQANISAGNAKFRLVGLADTHFPPLAHFDFTSEPAVTIEQQQLRSMLRQISYAQSDENRYLLNGILFSFQKTDKGIELTLVATDSRRLSLITQAVDAPETFADNEFILPAKTVAELERLLQASANLRFCCNEKQVAFELDLEDNAKQRGLMQTIYLVSKKIEGKYPNYRQIIPKDAEHHVQIERALLLECIQNATLLSNRETNTVHLTFQKNQLEVSASSVNGDAHTTLAIDYKGNALTIAFNARFLIDPLRALPNDTIDFEFTNERSPSVIRNNNRCICIVMPIILNASAAPAAA